MSLYTLSNITIRVLSGVSATLTVFFLTLLFSLPLGLIIAIARLSKVKIINYIVKFIISVLRGTPLMLQLIVWYYAPYYIFKIKINPEWRLISIILGFSINYAAYFAEIYRAGILSIPDGQLEAATILGYNHFQRFYKIILPQTIKRVIPPVTNEVITLIKDTSLAFVLAYTDVFTLAKQVSSKVSNVIPLFVAGLFYYIFNLIVAFTMERIEKAFDYYK